MTGQDTNKTASESTIPVTKVPLLPVFTFELTDEQLSSIHGGEKGALVLAIAIAILSIGCGGLVSWLCSPSCEAPVVAAGPTDAGVPAQELQPDTNQVKDRGLSGLRLGVLIGIVICIALGLGLAGFAVPQALRSRRLYKQLMEEKKKAKEKGQTALPWQPAEGTQESTAEAHGEGS